MMSEHDASFIIFLFGLPTPVPDCPITHTGRQIVMTRVCPSLAGRSGVARRRRRRRRRGKVNTHGVCVWVCVVTIAEVTIHFFILLLLLPLSAADEVNLTPPPFRPIPPDSHPPVHQSTTSKTFHHRQDDRRRLICIDLLFDWIGDIQTNKSLKWIRWENGIEGGGGGVITR